MPPITELRAGDPASIGGHEIRGRLGEGGQGVVYLGADEHGTLAAVKWLRPHLAGDVVAAERFAREAAAAQRVAPFCTAKVLATGVHEERPFIVSEYVEGPSLQQVVAEDGPRAESALHRLAIGTVTALAAIHQAGIVHRDLSPNNVLLAAEGPRVIDFGIARALDATSTITSTPIGTPAFMAPEQILAHPVGPPADLFAWASTIVFAASGASPFEAASVPEITQRVLNAEPDLTRLTGTLRDLVAACLSKDPARRPTAEQVILRLLEHPTSNPPELQQAAAMVGGLQPDPPPGPQSAPQSAPWAGQPGNPAGQAGFPVGQAGPFERAGASYGQVGAQAGPGYPVGYQGVGSGSRSTSGQYAQAGPYFQQPPRRGKKGYVIAAIAVGVAVVATVAVIVVAVAKLPGKQLAVATPSVDVSARTSSSQVVPTSNLSTSTLPGAGATLYENPADPVRLTTYMVRDTKTQEWVYYARDSLSGSFRKYPDLWESMLSPDGRYLAGRGKKFVNGYDEVRITDKVSGESFAVRTSQQPLSSYIQGWSRDSSRILLNVGNPVKGVWQSTGFAVVTVATRQATVSSLREGALRGVRYGFDRTGTGVVALANDTKQQALRFFTDTGQRVRRIPNVGAGIAESLFSPSGAKFLTNCPGLESGNNCVYDSESGAELNRFESPCTGLATWYDDSHVACWVRPDDGEERQQIQVLDFTGAMVRLLAEVPSNGANIDLLYTYAHAD
ncbi:serine/threonine-protein kinase [Nonomuraea sp. NPDC005983]|uniref:serine/threonine protein kinase n=1 Tax=Nonomuraea sp. NPDC005983 TaxID=3155595 RepID=UPI0033A31AEF